MNIIEAWEWREEIKTKYATFEIETSIKIRNHGKALLRKLRKRISFPES
jgi:hypothetical protein